MNKLLLGGVAALAVHVAFGRGECWVAKPSAPPPVETLTNEARYVEWKFREQFKHFLWQWGSVDNYWECGGDLRRGQVSCAQESTAIRL